MLNNKKMYVIVSINPFFLTSLVQISSRDWDFIATGCKKIFFLSAKKQPIVFYHRRNKDSTEHPF